MVVSYYANYSKFKKENPMETESFEGTPIGDDLDSWINVSKDLDKSILNVEKIDFAGGKAWFYGRIGGFAGEPYTIVLSEHNNHIYKIVFAREKKGLLSDEKKIISSFSFQ